MDQTRNILYFVAIAALIIITGMVQSWNSALLILNMGLISAVMALGVNLQWGFAGLFNVGVMGFVALGGLAAVLVSTDPVSEAWNAGGLRILFALAVGAGIIGATIIAYRRITATRPRLIAMVTILGLGFFLYRALLDPAVQAVEAVNPALQGNLGGLGLPHHLGLACWRPVCSGSSVDHWQGGLGAAFRLSGDCNTGHFRNYHRDPKKRGLVGAWREKRDWFGPTRAQGNRPTRKRTIHRTRKRSGP